MQNVKVIIWGLGAMGSGMAKMLLKKKGVEIVGAIDIGAKLGKSMYELVGVERGNRADVIVGTPEEVIKERCADVCLCVTDSFTRNAFDKFKFVLEKKINVISSAEQMAFPQAQEPELAKQIDELAKANGVSILGTGINPGLIMDLLVVVMTGCCESIDHVVSRRVNSLSPFGPTVMEEQGIGLGVDEFKKRVEDGTMAGHVGFHESINMIAEAIGWNVDKVTQSMDPIVTDVDRKAPYGFAKAGDVAGVAMKGYGYIDGEVKIEMDHPQQIEPEQVGVNTGDYVIIKGTPDINMVNSPEVPGGIGTIAMVVNMIPQIINAKAGLQTMISLPVPRAIMGDMRDRIDPECKIVK
ncbi:2,4-diaminopentanoate dehydrogenase [Sedimentibacter sp. MB31-C6]|uniref:2,4-diaminopentanoate dehydrogenase n=1 Tax=Sedimentibacter sp. MB31-C6 TaxID=3109366 RepID=UPI002DDD364A|nr:2,4-diaminopentanoate dehydrogenase [Sedimentibacter sp. MB36-C1]WSI04551.1 2,4-diaminopentanoate dehydrogenase [Sedimentibacter sp. MB36-C1]